MMKSGTINCTYCGEPYPSAGLPFRCACGGIYDFSRFPDFTIPKAQAVPRGVWHFKDSLGLPAEAPIVSLGEGNTPLMPWSLHHRQVYLKMECQNPTGSYKDRGTAVLTSFLLARGVKEVVEDSSGNAGASLAAYCARAGIKAAIYIPESASGPKRWQIERYGAEVHRVPGPRDNAAEAVLRAAGAGKVYASHAYMPFGLTGIATIAYEIWQSLGREPGSLISPVGHGGLLYGVMRGFDALFSAGLIGKKPIYIGVQAENCAPLVQAYRQQKLNPVKVEISASLAEGTHVSCLARGAQILERMQNHQGRMVMGSEAQLVALYRLSARSGYFCEPTSCLSLVPLLDDKIDLVEPVVAIMTGSGYKTNIILQ